MKAEKYLLFTTQHCPNCPAAKEFLSSQDKIKGDMIDAGTEEGRNQAMQFSIFSVPTAVFVDGEGNEVTRASGPNQIKMVVEQQLE